MPASIELCLLATFIAIKIGARRTVTTKMTCIISVVAWPKRIVSSDRSFKRRFIVIPLSVIGIEFLEPEFY